MFFHSPNCKTTLFIVAIAWAMPLGNHAAAQRQMEHLGRGVIAVGQPSGGAFISWRLLATDPESIAFNVYRLAGESKAIKLNGGPVRGPTWFIDPDAKLDQPLGYVVKPVIDGREEANSTDTMLPVAPHDRPWLSVPLQTTENYRPNDASVGDLDGDGEYEIVLHQAARGRDNSQPGTTDPPLLEAYTLTGRRLWQINLGHNIREGAHYTQFMVYDLDSDGRAEVACKTGDGTIDGQGTVLGDAHADFRNSRGYVLDGPEFITIFDGLSGAALATLPYLPPRGKVADWGDDYGNRVDRFLACVAYLDGQRPSLVMCRGYYTRTVLAAWNWRGGRLSHLWTFDSHDGTPGNRDYAGQGNHNLSVGDLDGDGKDEIVYGACAIDEDGRGLYTTRLGHGDALHLSDLDPDRPGLEVFDIHEHPRHDRGIEFRDAKTGQTLWSKPSADVGRGLSADIDPRHRGCECWAAGPGLDRLFDCGGHVIGAKPRACNMAIWWDGDLLRELLDGTRLEKWDYEQGRTKRILDAAEYGCAANNGSKANPCLVADILGDWREEIIWRSADSRELRIFTTTVPTDERLPSLMHDPIYRLSVAWQNVGYNQPTQVGFFLGHGMPQPPRPPIASVPHKR